MREMIYKFPRNSTVKHKNGTKYRIVDYCKLESNLLDCYAYRGDEGQIWIRSVEEMEDGRFELIPK
jgi:hypothetical protein